MGQGEIGWLMNDFSLIFYVATENTPCFQLLSHAGRIAEKPERTESNYTAGYSTY